MGTLTLALFLAAAAAPQSSTVTLWPDSATPGTPSASDTASVEVGVRFTSDVDGAVIGIRFYKGSGNTGTHVGNLWDASGTNLATVTFTGETASGWQHMNFANPVPITANTAYVASVFCPAGGYAADQMYFAASHDNPPLHALQDGAQGANGIYAYGGSSAFPTGTYHSTNYWVDVIFSPSPSSPPSTPPPTPAPGSSGGSKGKGEMGNCGGAVADAPPTGGLLAAAALAAALLAVGARRR